MSHTPSPIPEACQYWATSSSGTGTGGGGGLGECPPLTGQLQVSGEAGCWCLAWMCHERDTDCGFGPLARFSFDTSAAVACSR